MPDIASLGIKVDATQADQAAKSLDGLTAAGARAEAIMGKTAATAKASATAHEALQKALLADTAATQALIREVGTAAASEALFAAETRKATVATAEGALAQKAAAAATEASAVVQVAAHGRVAGSAGKVREALVVLREAARGDFTRMIGSLTILADKLNLLSLVIGVVRVLLPPVAVAFAALAIGTHEINNQAGDLTKTLGLTKEQIDRVTNAHVTLGDVAKATWEVTTEAIKNATKDQTAAAEKFGERAIEVANNTAKGFVGAFVGIYDAIKAVWKNLPAALGDIAISAANAVIMAVEGMVNRVSAKINTAILVANAAAKAAGMTVNIPTIGTLSGGQLANPFAGAARQTGEDAAAAYHRGNLAGMAAVGNAESAISARAIADAKGRILDEAGKAAKARKGPAAPRDQTDERTAQVEAALATANAAELEAELGLVTDVRARAVLQKEVLAQQEKAKQAALDKQIADIAADKGLSQATKAQLTGTLEYAQGIDALTAIVKSRQIDDAAADAVAKEQLNLSQLALDGQTAALQLADSMAKTAGERRAIELKLLDLADQRAIAEYQGVIAAKASTAAQVEEAAMQIAILKSTKGARIDQVNHATQGPLEAYLDSLPKTAAEVNEAMESINAKGLKSLEDGLAEVVTGAKTLGSVFHDVAQQIIADLARIVIERSIIQPLGNALGTSGLAATGSAVSGGGGGIGGIGSAASGIGRLLGIGGASAAAIPTATGVLASGGLATVSGVAVTGAASAGSAGLLGGVGAALASNPIGWGIAAVGAVGLLFGAFNNGASKAQKAADAAKAAEEQLAQARQLAEDAGAKATATLQARRTIEISLMEATGDAAGALAAKRQDELAALDASNRGIQQLVYNATDANDAFDKASTAVDSARSDLTSAYQSEASAIQATHDKFQAFADSLKAFGDSLTTGPLASLGIFAQYSATSANFSATASSARGGDATALGGLQASAEAYLAASKDRASTLLEYNRDLAKVRSAVEDASRSAGQQVSAADQQLLALNASVSGLITVNGSVLSVRDAVVALNGALGNLAVAQAAKDAASAAAQAPAAAANDWAPGGAQWNAWAQGDGAINAAAGNIGEPVIANWTRAPQLFYEQYANAQAVGSLSVLDAAFGLMPGRTADFARSLGLPAFAQGGVAHQPTIGLFGERGSEAIMPLARGADGQLGVRAANSNDAAEEIRALREELRDALSRIANNTGSSAKDNRKTADTLVRVTRDGDGVVMAS